MTGKITGKYEFVIGVTLGMMKVKMRFHDPKNDWILFLSMLYFHRSLLRWWEIVMLLSCHSIPEFSV